MLQYITKKPKKPIINGEHLQRIVIDSNRQIKTQKNSIYYI